MKESKETQGEIKYVGYITDLLNDKQVKNEIDRIKSLPRDKKREEAVKFAKTHGLYWGIGTLATELFYGDGVTAPIEDDAWAHDMCHLIANWDEFLHPETYTREDEELDVRNTIFPVSIAISPMATKRDVLDFIEKRWDAIQAMLPEDREMKSRRFRRRSNRYRDSFIWENRAIGAKEIVKVLETMFPDQTISYDEVNKIISLERKRRKEITVVR